MSRAQGGSWTGDKDRGRGVYENDGPSLRQSGDGYANQSLAGRTHCQLLAAAAGSAASAVERVDYRPSRLLQRSPLFGNNQGPDVYALSITNNTIIIISDEIIMNLMNLLIDSSLSRALQMCNSITIKKSS